MGVPHLALDLGLRHQGGDGVDDDDVDGVGTHQDLDDLERLLARVGLADQKVVDLHADPRRVQRVQRMLGVDERGDPARLLGLGDDVQSKRRLARRLGPVDLGHAPARDASHP